VIILAQETKERFKNRPEMKYGEPDWLKVHQPHNLFYHKSSCWLPGEGDLAAALALRTRGTGAGCAIA